MCSSDLPAEARMRVGIVWRNSSATPTMDKKGYPLERLLELTTMPGFAFVSLQKDPSDEESRLLRQHKVTDLGDRLGDFADTAAAIAELDLVISVDTAAAHLAGALAKPVWLLLRQACDWRWFVERNDSPWYPTMRIFRQDKPGDWSSVALRLPVALAVEAGKVENA